MEVVEKWLSLMWVRCEVVVIVAVGETADREPVRMTTPSDRRVALGKHEKLDRKPSTTRRPREPKGWYSRGFLPHFDAPGALQHVTFHLADSLPKGALHRMQGEIEALPDTQKAQEKRKRLHELLDNGFGSCILDDETCADVVEKSLLFGDGKRYRLLAWTIMPNHVHVLIEQFQVWLLAKIVQSWKRHSSRQIHRLVESASFVPQSGELGSKAECNSAIPPLWLRDYWDRYIRNERHFIATKRYIENNPVSAGLVKDAGDWRWGSAWVDRRSED